MAFLWWTRNTRAHILLCKSTGIWTAQVHSIDLLESGLNDRIFSLHILLSHIGLINGSVDGYDSNCSFIFHCYSDTCTRRWDNSVLKKFKQTVINDGAYHFCSILPTRCRLKWTLMIILLHRQNKMKQPIKRQINMFSYGTNVNTHRHMKSIVRQNDVRSAKRYYIHF